MNQPTFLDYPILDKVLYKEGGKKKHFLNEVIKDYWTALVSRELSLQGRREVLTGKAKFGVFGDGKELAQIAMAKVFKKGDHRAGYYRDQTLMLALGISTPEQFLAQMYSDPANDPFSGGRQMTGHFATPYIDEEGRWTDHMDQYNISSGISCTAGQMGRAMGLAFASKKFRELKLGQDFDKFSRKGNEICFCTIGDASTSEGIFWETMNAAAVEKIPLLVAVWDDGYGISVPVEKQTVKGSISRAMEGFLRDENGDGIEMYTVNGYDYQRLCTTFEKASKKVRKKHIPALVHVRNLTQQQGHSTSGSHERYKSKERLSWEKEYDCNAKMEEWMLKNNILSEERIVEMKREARTFISERKKKAWGQFQDQNDRCRSELKKLYDSLINGEEGIYSEQRKELEQMVHPTRGEILQNARQTLFKLHAGEADLPQKLLHFVKKHNRAIANDFGTHLIAENEGSPLNVPVVHPEYNDESPDLPGYQIINTFFDHAFAAHEGLMAFGEDVGKIGDVNQGMAGLQEKYGEERIFDAGIREWSIVGQGVGMAMRGLRPIAEIQYLDYLVYALPLLTDDVATLRFRSKGQQQVPLIVRTRGHRLEGIWHTGSPLGMMINALRGIHILTPRNMVQAAGMYNTLLQGNDPAIVIECLNGYRLKEKLPANIGTYTVPIGIPEILTQGDHLTIVTYGSCVRYALQAVKKASEFGISVELIDVQTLLPFDLERIIISSIRKTSKVLFLDEDVPGGATSFMMHQVLEVQDGFKYLDAKPFTLTAKEHRTPYGNDGDYYSKPQMEDILELIYEIVFEMKMF